jgi:hypothetical protein
MHKLLAIVWLLVFSLHALGQQADTVITDQEEILAPAVEHDEDSAAYQVSPDEYEEDEEAYIPLPLFIPVDTIDALKRTKEYAYMQTLDSLLRNLNVEMNEEPEEPPSKSIFDIGIIKLIIWGVAIFAVLFILYQLFAGQQSLFAGNKKLMLEEEDLGLQEKTTSPLILSQQAAARGEYRLAIRYQYAYILQLLNEKNHIIFLPQKTNDQYLKEVREKPMASDFATLTLQYEYVWYGEFNLNKEQYESIAGGYRNFIKTWL